MKATDLVGDDRPMHAGMPGLVWLSYPCLGSKLKYILSACLGVKRMQVPMWKFFRAVSMMVISSSSEAAGEVGQ